MYLYERLEREKQRRQREEEFFKKTHPATVKQKSHVALMTSMSHTYGNVIAFMQKWVLENMFPENTFKTIHVNSKIAHRQIRSTSKEFLKKLKPMIIFRPRIASNDEERFLKDTPITERMTNVYPTWGGGDLFNFFEDPEHDFSIKYQINRSILYLDVVCIFSTLMQQVDYEKYLFNAVRWERPFSIPTALESFMPQEMLSIMSDITGVPLYDNTGSTYDFLHYMNGHSCYPITYKFNGGSGSKEFYRYYPVNIETTFSGLNMDEISTAGTVTDGGQIDFTIKMEFYSTGFYYLFSNNIYDINLPKPLMGGEDTEIIPIYTDVLLKEDLKLQPGWILYNRGSIRLENPDDVVSFDSLLNESLRTTLSYHLNNGLPLMDLIDIKVRKQGRLIHCGQEYDIDWIKKEIKFHNQDEYHTYSIYICANLEYINGLIKTIYNLK